jgi:hypothetical protein
VLIGHVSGGSFAADENLFIFHFNSAVLSFRQQVAACLSVHGFSSEGSGNQEYFSSFQAGFFHGFVQFQNFDFDQSELFGSDTLAFCSVMVGAHLLIFGGVD